MKIGVIIQARMRSTRLPGKIFKKIGGKPILEWVVDRCKLLNNVSEIIIATTTNEQDDKIVEWCKEQSIPYFRGSETNVLERYVQCAEFYNLDWIIRVTSDCPFLDYKIANEVIKKALQNQEFDLWAIKENWTRGLAIELVKLESLKKITKYSQDELYKEHVTLYLYKDSVNFTKRDFYVPDNRRYPQFRLTVDTHQDFEVCEKIANNFMDSSIDCQDIFKFLEDNPEIYMINSDIKQNIVSGND